VETISQTASRIAAGNLTERIATSNSHTELDQLGHVLNDTFERLAGLIEQQKRFTADASHELRTPLTVIISETQRALKRDRNPEEYRTIITHCQTAAKRMHSLVNSLLLLARQDTETDIANQPTTDLAAVASSAADMLAPLAAERSTKIQRHLSHAPVAARPEVLEILLQNLLGNAISHTPEGTLVTVRTSVCDGCVLLEVHDNGPGIPPEHLPHLFDRFYRADAARTQGSGHSGLGLAIVRSIVKNLHGRIEVESSPSIGTTFRISLPNCY
jgi:heavy metal sensor kinase